MALDAASLKAITEEIRICFLTEDAPDQLAILEQGIRHLRTNTATNLQAEYAVLMRAAHSLKGGAGIAQFLILSRVAHHLEDLLQLLHQGCVPDCESAYELLSLSVEQISGLIATASTNQEQTVNVVAETTLSPILTALENFLQALPPVTSSANFAQGTKTKAQDSLNITSKDTSETNAPTPWVPQGIRSLNLRMPVSRLDRINNTIGELFISYERLSRHQEQLHQVDQTLKQRATALTPLSEQVEAIYELSTPLSSSIANFGTESKSQPPLKSSDAPNIHSTVQNLQELIVQVQEARSDVELISDEFREALVELRSSLEDLRKDVTESRLVRFGFLAGQFLAAQQTFSQRYNKSVELGIIGKETLIDRVILEQLKIPLLHLFRNAFDHGIETPEERQMQGKSPTAHITLAATIQGNQIVIKIADDGRGIDLQSVCQRAKELGLCNPKTTKLTKEQVLEFLFQPGFSTAATVTTLSGRGLGLDIVRVQVERLRGCVEVETKWGQGTMFTISIPLTINILPLLLCKCQDRTLAIPANKVKEIIALSEYGDLAHRSTITWRDRPARLYSLRQLLPYTRGTTVFTHAPFNHYLGIVLEVDGEIVVLAVDSLLGERELVLKPFDLTVKVPAYVLGCTVLGTGEVVPVLSPDYFGDFIARAQSAQVASEEGGQNQRELQPYSQEAATILIVDDSIAFRRILEHILGKNKYKIIQCKDGKEALEKLNEPGVSFDLVISDIEMPRVDGLELLKEIRSSPVWHNLPVVMLTSRENQWHRQTASNLGATDYLSKPFRHDQLLSTIATLLT